MDDMESFVYFQLGYMKAQTLLEKATWLLKPNNEHRIFLAKLVTVIMQAFTGEINFRWLILIASILIAGIIGIFYRIFKTIQVPLIAFLPVLLLLLHPQYYLITLSAVTSFQHQTAICLTFAGFYLLAKPGFGRLSGALALQILASFSMSNSLFGWFGGVASLLVQRRFKEALAWGLIGVLTIYLYLYGFANPQGNETSLGFFMKHPHLVFLGFFTFSGALLDFFPDALILPRSILPTLAGFALMGAVLWMLKRMLLPWPAPQKKQDPRAFRRNFFVGAYVFLLLNAAIIAFLRPRFGYAVMLISNYTVYSLLLAIVLYLNGLSEYSNGQFQRKWITVALGGSLLICSVMYFRYWPRVAERKQMFEAFAFNQKYNGIGLGPMLGSEFAASAKKWMDGAVTTDIYHYPAAFYTPYEQRLLDTIKYTPSDNISLAVEEQPSTFELYTQQWQVPDKITNACYIVKSAERTYLFPIRTLFLPKPFFLHRKLPTLAAQVYKTMLYPGVYQVGLLLCSEDAQPIRYVDQRLTIKAGQ